MARRAIVFSSGYLTVMQRLVKSRRKGNDSAFALNVNEAETDRFFPGQENATYKSEVDYFRQVSSLSGRSRFDAESSFLRRRSDNSVEIIGLVGVIEAVEFYGCQLLTEVIFSSENKLTMIDGFEQFSSLRRVEIASSVEMIGRSAFSEWRSLTGIIFSSKGHLRKIHEFPKCSALCRLEFL
jgi:hypothetical protein